MFLKFVLLFTIIFLITQNYDYYYYWARVAQLVEALHHKTLGGVLEIFEVTYSCSVYSIALGSTQPLREMSTKEYPWG